MGPFLSRCLLTQRDLEQAYHWGLALEATIVEPIDRSEARKEQIDGDLGGAVWQTDLLCLAFQGPTLDLDSYCLLLIESGQDSSHFDCFDPDVDLTWDTFISSPLYEPSHIVIRRGGDAFCMLMFIGYDWRMLVAFLVLVCRLQIEEGRRYRWWLICCLFTWLRGAECSWLL